MSNYNQESRRKARAKFDKSSTTKQYAMRLQKKDMELFDKLCKERGVARHELFSDFVEGLK